MTEHETGLTSGATHQPAVANPAEHELELLRHQQRTIGWDAATPLVHDATQAYREIMASRDKPGTRPSGNRFL